MPRRGNPERPDCIAASEGCGVESDHPEVMLKVTFRQTCDRFRAAFADLTDAGTCAIFAGNVSGFCRIPDQPLRLADLT